MFWEFKNAEKEGNIYFEKKERPCKAKLIDAIHSKSLRNLLFTLNAKFKLQISALGNKLNTGSTEQKDLKKLCRPRRATTSK